MTGLRVTIRAVAAWIERQIEQTFFRGDVKRLTVEPYHGYATPDHLVARGRVLAARESDKIDGKSKIANFRQMIRLFATHEVADVTVTSGRHSAMTDAEGYFTLLHPRGGEVGWIDVAVSIQGGDSAVCPVLVARPDAAFVIVSDIDDTMMYTGAWSTVRNLWTSFTGNVESRVVFPDAIDLIDLLRQGGRNPVYFVSSSPWNFHGFLDGVFARAGLPQAPKFLKDYGFGKDQFITRGHGGHKGTAIESILAAHPDLGAVLIGDTGQHDAQIYADAAVRHPSRIRRVILRAPGSGADAADLSHVERLRDLGIQVHVGPDYTKALAEIPVPV